MRECVSDLAYYRLRILTANIKESFRFGCGQCKWTLASPGFFFDQVIRSPLLISAREIKINSTISRRNNLDLNLNLVLDLGFIAGHNLEADDLCESRESVAHLEPRWWMNSADGADDLEIIFHPLLLITCIVIVARERVQHLLLYEEIH